MTNKIFIGNLPFKTREPDLVACFEAAGQVVNANIVTREGRSLGYGFVEYADPEDALRAIELFDKKDFDGRIINVELSSSTLPTKGARQNNNIFNNNNNNSSNNNNSLYRPFIPSSNAFNTVPFRNFGLLNNNSNNNNNGNNSNRMMGYYQGFSFNTGNANDNATTSSSTATGNDSGLAGLAEGGDAYSSENGTGNDTQDVFGDGGDEEGKIHPSLLYAMKYSPYFRPYYPESQTYNMPSYNLYGEEEGEANDGNGEKENDGDNESNGTDNAADNSNNSGGGNEINGINGGIAQSENNHGEVSLGDPATSTINNIGLGAFVNSGNGNNSINNNRMTFGGAGASSLFYHQGNATGNMLYGQFSQQQQQHQQHQQFSPYHQGFRRMGGFGGGGQPFHMKGVWNGGARRMQQQNQQQQQRRIPYEERQVSEDTVFVMGLPLDYDDARLADLFADAATVKKAYVVRFRTTNKSKGYGFVTFESEAEKDYVLTTMKEIRVGDNILTVKTSYVPSKKVY